MFEYILRLLILLPLVGGMAWGSLWLWKKVQMGTLQLPGQGAKRARAIEMIDVMPLGPGTKLTVVEFAGQRERRRDDQRPAPVDSRLADLLGGASSRRERHNGTLAASGIKPSASPRGRGRCGGCARHLRVAPSCDH